MKYKNNNIEVLTQTKKAMLDKAMKPFDGSSEGPFKVAFDKMEGVFRKEVVNYKVKNGYLYKETAIREFTEGDYHDTVKIETLSRVETPEP